MNKMIFNNCLRILVSVGYVIFLLLISQKMKMILVSCREARLRSLSIRKTGVRWGCCQGRHARETDTPSARQRKVMKGQSEKGRDLQAISSRLSLRYFCLASALHYLTEKWHDLEDSSKLSVQPLQTSGDTDSELVRPTSYEEHHSSLGSQRFPKTVNSRSLFWRDEIRCSRWNGASCIFCRNSEDLYTCNPENRQYPKRKGLSPSPTHLFSGASC